MKYLIGLFGGLMSLALTACGGGQAVHIIERTKPPAGQIAGSTEASASATSHPPASGEKANAAAQSIYTPPDFPTNYRTRIAVALVLEYLKYGRGPATITTPVGKVGLLGSNTTLCVQYPVDKRELFGPISGTQPRTIPIFAHRAVGTFGQTRFKRGEPIGEWAVADSCPGTATAFVELDQVVQKLNDCRAKDQRRCVVNEEPNRRDILDIPKDAQ